MAKARRGRKRDRERARPEPNEPTLRSPHVKRDGSPKRAYTSEGEALSVADERRWENGVILTAYRCAICSAWHLGGQRDA